MSEVMRDWIEGWELRKAKAARKIQERKTDWYKEATSDEAEVRYAKGVVEAAKERRRQKSLKAITPDDWAEKTITGIESKSLSEEEAKKWYEKAAPYIELVKWAREKMKETGLKGIEAGQFWQREVVPRLARARRKPEEIPKIRSELERVFASVKRPTTKPESIEIIIK